MKTSNVGQGRAHHEAIIRGWVASDRAGGTGITIGDGTQSGSGVWNLTVRGGTLIINGDGSAVLVIDDSGTVLEMVAVTGDISNPPTEAELEALIDLPANVVGTIYEVTDSSTGRRYRVVSTGLAFALLLEVAVAGSTGAPSTVTAAPAGGWTQVVQPVVESPNGDYVYFGYTNGTTGAATIASYRKSTGVVAGTFSLRTFTPDTHTAPVAIVRASDHKLVVAYSDHTGTQLYVRISTNSVDSDPTLSGGFAAEQTLDAAVGGALYTYPTLLELSDGIYLFFRDEQNAAADGVLSYTKSTTGNSGTWSAAVEVWKIPTKLCYWVITGSGSRFDVTITDGSPPAGETPVALYHFYNVSGTYYKSDGTAISAALPLDNTDATLIDSGATGDIWPSDIAYTSDGRPVVAAMRKTGVADNDWVYAIWTGSAWFVSTITNSNGVTEGSFASGPALDHGGPERIIYQRKSGSHWELNEAVTGDSGLTWTTSAVTSGSSTDYLTPRAVLDHTSGIWAFALKGTYTDYLNNNLGIVAIGPTTTNSLLNLSRSVTMRGTKANAIAFSAALEEVAFAYATDTSEFGVYTNGSWVWIGATALIVQDEGSPLTTAATTLNFVGSGVVASGSGATKTITISGGTSATDANLWRPVLDGSGLVVADGTGQAVMAYGPA